ncbi:MAG: hypothetical protein LC804_28240, partial [Acidobacteria bacterium]|nr:hypothetical protein [Acidobacteriota bacterium]
VDIPAAPAGPVREDIATLFGESASRAIVSALPGSTPQLLDLAARLSVPARVIGRTGGSRIAVAIDGRQTIDCAVAEAEERWSTAIDRYFAERAA